MKIHTSTRVTPFGPPALSQNHKKINTTSTYFVLRLTKLLSGQSRRSVGPVFSQRTEINNNDLKQHIVTHTLNLKLHHAAAAAKAPLPLLLVLIQQYINSTIQRHERDHSRTERTHHGKTSSGRSTAPTNVELWVLLTYAAPPTTLLSKHDTNDPYTSSQQSQRSRLPYTTNAHGRLPAVSFNPSPIPFATRPRTLPGPTQNAKRLTPYTKHTKKKCTAVQQYKHTREPGNTHLRRRTVLQILETRGSAIIPLKGQYSSRQQNKPNK